MNKKLVAPVLIAILVLAGVKIFNLKSQPQRDSEPKMTVAQAYKVLQISIREIDPQEQLRAGSTVSEIKQEITTLKKLLLKYQRLEKETLYPFETYAAILLQAFISELIDQLNREMTEKMDSAI